MHPQLAEELRACRTDRVDEVVVVSLEYIPIAVLGDDAVKHHGVEQRAPVRDDLADPVVRGGPHDREIARVEARLHAHPARDHVAGLTRRCWSGRSRTTPRPRRSRARAWPDRNADEFASRWLIRYPADAVGESPDQLSGLSRPLRPIWRDYRRASRSCRCCRCCRSPTARSRPRVSAKTPCGRAAAGGGAAELARGEVAGEDRARRGVPACSGDAGLPTGAVGPVPSVRLPLKRVAGGA